MPRKTKAGQTMEQHLFSKQLKMGTLKLSDFCLSLVESGANKDQGASNDGMPFFLCSSEMATVNLKLSDSLVVPYNNKQYGGKIVETGDSCVFYDIIAFSRGGSKWPFQYLSVSTGPLGVSSSYRGPKLNILEMQIAPGKPEIHKSEVRIWNQHIFSKALNAEKLICSLYFGILFILCFSRDHVACKTRMSTPPQN